MEFPRIMTESVSFYTVVEVAEMLRVWSDTVRSWLLQDELRGVKLPGGDSR